MKLDHQFTLYTRINSKWIRDSSPDAIKVLEGNIGNKIPDIPHNSIFVNTPSKARETKEKINKWDYIKLKSYCMAKKKSTK